MHEQRQQDVDPFVELSPFQQSPSSPTPHQSQTQHPTRPSRMCKLVGSDGAHSGIVSEVTVNNVRAARAIPAITSAAIGSAREQPNRMSRTGPERL